MLIERTSPGERKTVKEQGMILPLIVSNSLVALQQNDDIIDHAVIHMCLDKVLENRVIK